MVFRFKQFSVKHSDSALKVGTDAVLLGAWTRAANANHILDIGTGCGIIALMLAQRSHGRVTGIEPDNKSYLEAAYNFKKSVWFDRLTAIPVDLSSFVASEKKKFDLIVSNPPYYQSKAYAYSQLADAPDSRRVQAASQHGLRFDELLGGVAELLDDNGKFTVIFPYGSKSEFIKNAEQHGLMPNKELDVKSKYHLPYIRSLIEFGKRKTTNERNELVIYDSEGKRSEAYAQLTADYYL